MELEDSLLRSQEPATCPCSESSSPFLAHFTSWRYTLISCHLRLGLLCGLFPSGFSTKILYALLLSPIHATCSAYITVLDSGTWRIFGENYRSWSSSLFYVLSLFHILWNIYKRNSTIYVVDNSLNWIRNATFARRHCRWVKTVN